jgi:alpha-maltose-1-phosphate synthase
MTILFGHPTGNPNSHQAALAHFEAGQLEAFCVPWMPSPPTLKVLEHLPPLRSMAQRLARRNFPPLDAAPKIQGRIDEVHRLIRRAIGRGDERLSYEANDWLMRTMSRECHRSPVTAVHAYEDCSLWQFEEAKRRGKACIYDMPIGYYPAWEQTQAELVKKYADWLPVGGLPSSRYVRPDQKRREMELADLVLVPSQFVANTVRSFFPNKEIMLAPYGMDTSYWHPIDDMAFEPREELAFLFVGQCSIRKGLPLLLDAWNAADLKHARLRLVGTWQLAEEKKMTMPPSVTWEGHVSRNLLREYYQQADVFVFPTFFEGRALAIGEALASGLPVLTTPASGVEDLIDDTCGRLIPSGSLEATVEGLKWFAGHRELLPTFSSAARKRAEGATWEAYRLSVTNAVAPLV